LQYGNLNYIHICVNFIEIEISTVKPQNMPAHERRYVSIYDWIVLDCAPDFARLLAASLCFHFVTILNAIVAGLLDEIPHVFIL